MWLKGEISGLVIGNSGNPGKSGQIRANPGKSGQIRAHGAEIRARWSEIQV